MFRLVYQLRPTSSSSRTLSLLSSLSRCGVVASSPAAGQVRYLARLPDDPTITAAITHDHRELEDYYGRIMALDEEDYDSKSRWQNQLTWELARHAVGEEIVLYPAYERYLGTRGKQMADKDRDSHQKTKEHLEHFQRLYPRSKEFRPQLVELMEELKKHMRAEEQEELPMLEEALAKAKPEGQLGGKSRSQELALSFSRTKMFVPTRGHPWLPNRPPYETVMGLLAMPVDVLADMFRKFPKEKQTTTESLSGGLK